MSESTKNLFFTLLGGLLALATTMLVEQCYRPAQLRTQIQSELFRATYDKRIDAYQTLVQMFADVYWLERELAEVQPNVKKKRRLELIEKVNRHLIRSTPIINETAFRLGFAALNFYAEHSGNFTPDMRSKWVNDHAKPLVNVIRKDLHLDEIARGVAENVSKSHLSSGSGGGQG